MKKLILAATATLSLAAGANQALARDNLDRHVNLVNQTDQSIVSFYASNVGSHVWNWDLLGADVLGPDHYTRLDLNDYSGYCRFDFRTVLDDGTVFYRYDVNVCTLDDYIIG
jgi:hypothetical protein